MLAVSRCPLPHNFNVGSSVRRGRPVRLFLPLGGGSICTGFNIDENGGRGRRKTTIGTRPGVIAKGSTLLSMYGPTACRQMDCNGDEYPM